MSNNIDIQKSVQKFLDLQDELEDIKIERKNKNTEYKELEQDIRDYLENSTLDKTYSVDNYKFYLSEHQNKKTLSQDLLKQILTNYFNGNTDKAKELASYIWQSRPVEYRTYLKVSRPRRKKSTN